MKKNLFILKNAIKCGKYYVYNVPISEMVVDSDYQRPTTNTVQTLYKLWDDEKCDPLLVNYREKEDKFYIIDGSHRFYAATLLGKDTLPCKILVNKTKEAEAEIFYKQQDNVAILKPYDKFKAALVAKNPIALKTKELMDKYDIKVLRCPYQTNGAIRCLAYCWKMIEDSKFDTLDWVLNVIELADWHQAAGAYNKTTIHALESVYNAFNNVKGSERIMANILHGRSPKQVQISASAEYSWLTSYGALSSYLTKTMNEVSKAQVIEFDNKVEVNNVK